MTESAKDARFDTPRVATYRKSRKLVEPIILVMVGLSSSIALGVTSGMLAALITANRWISYCASRYIASIWLFVVVAATFSGSLLFIAQPYNIHSSFKNAAVFTMFMLGVSCAGIMTAWIAEQVGVGPAIAFISLGLLLKSLTALTHGAAYGWKYGMCVPITIMLIGTLRRWFGRAGVVASLFLSIGISVASDARSAAGLALGALIAWAVGEAIAYRRPTLLNTATLTTAALLVVASILHVAQRLFLSGYLGTAAEEKTALQTQNGTSILDGGRPEWRISADLVSHFPMGFGPGAIPGYEQKTAGANALARVGLSVKSDYFSDYVFGPAIKLHSILADLWSNFGLVGLAYGAALFGGLFWALLRELLGRHTDAALCFLCLSGMWAVLFSPLLTSFPLVSITAGLMVARNYLRKRSEGPVLEQGVSDPIRL